MVKHRYPELAAHIGRRARKRREELGLSAYALSKAFWGDDARQGEIERGKHAPGAAALYLLARALRVTPDYFFQELDLSPIEVSVTPRPPSAKAIARRIARLRAEKRAEILALLETAGEEG
ncbi:MAG: helix-turn-helix domain-containing protein [Burkholderiales bacterium]|nr:helix-turn-helix domain-containing protein [Burkholderiales bacterium]